MTLLEFCSTLNGATELTEPETEAQLTTQSAALPNSHTDVGDNSDVAVMVAPYLLIATTIISVLIVDFIRYRRKNAYKYRRKQEKGEHNHRYYRKIRGAARVPMDPEHLTLCAPASTAVENNYSNISAHDQGHEYADDDIGGLSAAVTAENSKTHLANKAKFAASSHEAENGMAAWQLKFGKSDPTQARFMHVSSVNKK